MKNFESRIFGNLLLFALSATIAGAQIAEKRVLTLEGARRVIAAAEAEAKKLNAPGGVVAVVDDGGNLMALERLDATFSAGANISIGKARTAVMFKKPTRFFEELINASGKGRTVMTAVKDFTPLKAFVVWASAAKLVPAHISIRAVRKSGAPFPVVLR